MPTPLCRLLPTQSLSGQRNMAADEVMLQTAGERGIASLRFYTWTEPTLSLGYFQHAADRLNDSLVSTAAWVRRPTGGGAILHHFELTYCLAVPAGAPWQSKESWICRFHQTIAAALLEFGIEARSVACGEEKKSDPFLCFHHQTSGDLLIDGCKVVGSALRKMCGALMQHGSILLAQSPLTPSLPGIADLSGRRIAPAELQSALIRHFTSRLSWIVERDAWTETEIVQIESIARNKYSTSAWNEKR
jgi:lipoyl(octanoyl) transferase